VETLNQWAQETKLDITKLSFPAFFQTTEKYILLNAGSALGKGVGPLLISKKANQFSIDNIRQSTIAIPGLHTTANLLLNFAFPGIKHTVPMIFSAIENAVLSGKTELGVIIHENRFTYRQKGLHKQMDLGEYWEQKMKLPIPLGGIAIKAEIDKAVARKVNSLIQKSLEWAYANYPGITDFVRQHSQEMSEDVMRQHIELYVNDYSIELGKTGKEAIDTLYKTYSSIQKTFSHSPSRNLFLL
jgi:1,4-dihydroxy-6-naphthoate synthase